MKRFKAPNSAPIIPVAGLHEQRGASLIAAIFLMTTLLVLGALMTQLMILGSEETINEWYSAQALYAAESGAEWSIYNSGSAASDQVVIGGSAWFDVTVTTTNFNGGNVLYTINSTGKAGNSSANPRTQREIMIQHMP